MKETAELVNETALEVSKIVLQVKKSAHPNFCTIANIYEYVLMNVRSLSKNEVFFSHAQIRYHQGMLQKIVVFDCETLVFQNHCEKIQFHHSPIIWGLQDVIFLCRKQLEGSLYDVHEEFYLISDSVPASVLFLLYSILNARLRFSFRVIHPSS